MPRWVVNEGKHTRFEKGKRVVYKPGDEFDASEDAVSTFVDKLERINPSKKPVEQTEEVPEPITEPEETEDKVSGLEMEHQGAGRWNVINPVSGKAINSKLLSREEAQALIDA